MKDRLCKWARVALCVAGAAPGMHAQGYTYSTFSVSDAAPATDGSLGVQAINKSGVVVGWLVDTSNNTKAWVRATDGTITVFTDPLNTGTPAYTGAYGINNAGSIVGIFTDTAAGDYPGFIESPSGKFRTFNLPNEPSGTATFLEGVNNHSGNYCGSVGTSPEFNYQAFVDLGGEVTIFTIDGSTDAGCVAINDSNVAVGFYYDSAGLEHGWSRDPSTGDITTINEPNAVTVTGTAACWGTGFGGTEVLGINDKGEISGHYWDKNYKSHGFLLTTTGKFKELNVPGAYQTGGGGINASGQITGHYSDSSCNNYGFIATPE